MINLPEISSPKMKYCDRCLHQVITLLSSFSCTMLSDSWSFPFYQILCVQLFQIKIYGNFTAKGSSSFFFSPKFIFTLCARYLHFTSTTTLHFLFLSIVSRFFTEGFIHIWFTHVIPKNLQFFFLWLLTRLHLIFGVIKHIRELSVKPFTQICQ